jgi:hypothetical protein
MVMLGFGLFVIATLFYFLFYRERLERFANEQWLPTVVD